MTLVVARIEGKHIVVVGDTQLTHINQKEKRLKTQPSDGIVKSAIINDNICVSFANVVENAESAIKEIKRESTILEILPILEGIHHSSGRETDFIVCAGLPSPVIYEIKNGSLQNVKSAWIGSQDGYNIFQKAIIENRQIEANNTNLNIEEATPEIPLFSKMSSAIDFVIEDESVPDVRGFKTNILFRSNRFEYMPYLKFYREELVFSRPGISVIGHGTAQSGSYSLFFIGSSPDYMNVALHLRQGKLGILYRRVDNGLLWPEIHEGLDEVDFIDYISKNYSIHPRFVTEDKAQKYFNDAYSYFQKGNWFKAYESIEQALKDAADKLKCEAMLLKGACLIKLNQQQSAALVFNELVKIDPTYIEKVATFLGHKKK